MEREAIPKEVRNLYDKAEEAIARKNYDYAIHLLREALLVKGDFDEGRRILRKVEKMRVQEMPPSFFQVPVIYLKNVLPLLKALYFQLKKVPARAVSEYETALEKDPSNKFFLLKLGECLAQAGFTDAAIDQFEDVYGADRANLAAMKSLGMLYSEKKDYKKARYYYESAQKVVPKDEEISTALKEIAALGTIEEGRWEEQKTYREGIKDKEVAAALEAEDRIVRTDTDLDTLIRNNRRKLDEDPNNPPIIRTLGDLYSRKGSYDEAVAQYRKFLELDPKNLAVQRKIVDTQIAKMDASIKDMEEKLKGAPQDKSIEAKIKDLRKERSEFKFDALRRNIEEHPNDLQLRFEYGVALMQSGKTDDAISEFQMSVHDPVRRGASLNYLGLCFKTNKMYDLAISEFEKALERQGNPRDTMTKEILYNLGTVYEEMGNREKARESFKKVFQVDINFKDVAKKVTEAYKG